MKLVQKLGLVTGQRVFPDDYLGTNDFQDGLCLVSTMKTIAYIDHSGRTIWEGLYVAGK
jgi:hypothetical protein